MENTTPEVTPITLSVEDLKALDNFIQELPTKYGLPLIQFFSQIKAREVADVE